MNDLLPDSAVIFDHSCCPSKAPLQGSLAERGAYVRGLGKLAEAFSVGFMFYKGSCSNVY